VHVVVFANVANVAFSY